MACFDLKEEIFTYVAHVRYLALTNDRAMILA